MFCDLCRRPGLEPGFELHVLPQQVVVESGFLLEGLDVLFSALSERLLGTSVLRSSLGVAQRLAGPADKLAVLVVLLAVVVDGRV